MPTYRLHLHECGTVVEDESGVDLRDLDAARRAAIDAARDVMAGEVKDGRLCLGCCIVIADQGGVELDRVPFRDAIKVSGL